MDAPRSQVWVLAEPADDVAFAALGWDVRRGWTDPEGASRTTLLTGVVDDEATSAAALQAIALGRSVAAQVLLVGLARHRFLDDLARLGIQPHPGAPAGPDLDADQAQLLDLLGRGATVTDAAKLLHVSRRTANRLLERARAALGAATTAEAVGTWALRRGTTGGGRLS